MAYTKISLTNGLEVKTAPIGFSWTVFFFGGFPCLFRHDWVWAICLFIASALTSGIAAVVAAFFYNKIYVKSLLNSGWKIRQIPLDVTEEKLKNYLGFVELPMEKK